MPVKHGKYTISLTSSPRIAGWAAVVGKKEGEGPLGAEFAHVYDDVTMGKPSWEQAESEMLKDAVSRAVDAAKISMRDVNILFSGDLLAQNIGTTFAVREMNIPHVGLYGACSTMSLSLCMAALSVDSGFASTAAAATCSHFCSAEKQFRMPLEYGGQRPPTAQWTATASGAAIIKDKGEKGPKIESVIIGKIVDFGVKDANNMGSAMAPAACETILSFLEDTNTRPEDYDMILTGDLGSVGTSLLLDLTKKQGNVDIDRVHADCGTMIYDIEKQAVNSGASGCGCSAAVLCSYILRRLAAGELKRVLFVGTGALMSPVSSMQGETIPAIAHGVLLTSE